MKKNFLLILSIFAIISANINSQEYYEGEYEFAFGEHQIANNNITINTSENIEYLHITNLNREIICRFENITNNTTISVSSLPESLYLIVAQTKDGNILNEKIIVKH